MTALMNRLSKHTDMAIALAVVLVVVMLIVPLPPWLLDLFIAANISVGLMVVIATMYVGKALEFSSFPSLLLITTMFRLAINVSVTRLILLEGDAGHMVEAFGNFVVGGNLVVGIVIFLILVVIQFIVVTNGAGRVAEVAARFTLDAMPGKQMAIDADLNAGQITEEQARERREEVTREADFYGAMDGASKFVKGDAIAAIIIVIINIVGGITIGVLQQGLPFAEAAQRFTLLTIGDGLAAQIPALLISVATGILVTRSASKDNLGSDITGQIGRQPRALKISGGVIAAFALVPGLPKVPFLVLGASLFFVGRASERRMAIEREEALLRAAEQDTPAEDDPTSHAVRVDPLELAIGFGLVPFADQRAGGTLLARVATIRKQIASELGLVIGKIRIHDDSRLQSHEYVIKVRGAEVARAVIVPSHKLAIDPGEVLGPVKGIATTEPAFGMPAVWIDDSLRAEAEGLGYQVVDAEAVIITHLTETIRRHVGQLLSQQETQDLLDALKADNAAVVEEVVPDLLSVGEVQRVLQQLLSENVPVRDLSVILEAIRDKARQQIRDPELLSEYARRALARSLTEPYLDETQTLRVITLAQPLEQEVAKSVTDTSDGQALALDPARAEQLVRAISEQQKLAQQMGFKPAMLCSGRVRRHLQRLIGQAAPQLPVFSYQEVSPGLRVETIASVSI